MQITKIARILPLSCLLWFWSVSGYAQTHKLIHFWDFNNTVPLTGIGDVGGNDDSLGNSAHLLPADYTTLPLANARVIYSRPLAKQPPATKKDSVLDNATGGALYYDYSGSGYNYYHTSDSLAAGSVCGCSGNLCVRTRNPCLNSYFYLYVPTTGYMNINLDFAITASGGSAAQYNIFSYSTDGGSTWNKLTSAMDTFNISSNRLPDTLLAVNSVTAARIWYPVSINFSSAGSVNNNGNFIIRFLLSGSNSSAISGYNKYDNISLLGDSICPVMGAQPQSVSVCAGTNSYFAAHVLGGLNDMYQWQVNSGSGFTDVSNGGVYGGAATDSLTLTDIPIGMSGYKYRCIISCNTCANDTSLVATLTVKPEPSVTAHATFTSVCAGTSVTLTGGGAASYVWTGGVTNTVAFVPVATNTYTVTGTGANGCIDTASIGVVVNPVPVVTANTTFTSVCAGNNVTLTGGGASSYTWTGGITDGVSFIPASTKTYTVTGTSANGCTNTASITVTVNTVPTVTANASITTICAGSSVILVGGGSVSYSWTGGVTNGIAFIPGSTQTYTVTGTAADGCTNTASITVTVNPVPVVTANASAINICAGSSETLTGGGAVSYTWTGGVTDGVSFVPLSTKTYTVTGTGADGCTNTASITVTVNPVPTVTAHTTANNVCAASSVILTGGGAVSYTWTGGVTDGVAFFPVSTQTYTVTGTAADGCTNTASITITVKPLPPVTANATSTNVCAGTSVTLTGGGAVSYSWTGGITNAVAFTPVSTKTYTVTGTGANGCTDTASIGVVVNPAPVVTANANLTNICAGTSVTLTGGGASSYSWTGGVTDGVSFVPVSTKTYTVTGTGADGCTNTASITVTVNAVPTVTANASATTVCSGTSVIVVGGGASSYSWTGGVTNGIAFTPVSTQTYTVTGTAADGCTNTASITITVNSVPTVTANATTTTICAGTRITLTGGGAISYTWSGGVTDGVSFVPGSTNTYTVTGLAANGCTGTASIIITVNPLPSLSISPAAPTICYNSSVVLTASGATSYVWSPTGAGLSCTNCNITTASPPSSITYTLVGTNSFGCIDSTIVPITMQAKVVSSISGMDTICSGNTTVLTASGGNKYLWNTGATTSNIIIGPSSNSTYSVIVSVANCSDTSDINVVVNPSPIPFIIGNDSICAGDSTALTASGGGTYLWNIGRTTSIIEVALTITTTYTVTVSNTLCSKDTFITIVVTPVPVPAVSTTQYICLGNSVNLIASGGISYFWSPSTGLNQNTISNPIANPTVTTIYTVTVASGKCKSTDTVIVNVQPIPVEVITPESIINIGQSIMLAVSPQDSGYTYLWTPATGLNCNNCPSPVANPTVTTTYFAITTDSIGCQTGDTVTINVTDICGQYFVPNAFSPNGDGHNDILQVYGNGLCIQEMDFVIYDRWGEKIFESMSQENGWDGTYKGKKMNPDTYAYFFSATLINGNSIQKSGNVTLVR